MLPDYAKAFRRTEVEALRHFFPPGARVLEIGGGTGFQAGILASWGCQVVSVDIPTRQLESAYFPVDSYDGEHLPYADCAFDVVFSSNVLDDIPPSNLSRLLAEIRRVAETGLVIHMLPTPAWRFWTMLGHYPDVFRSILRYSVDNGYRRQLQERAKGPDPILGERRSQLFRIARYILIDSPQSAYSNPFLELYLFRRAHWRRVFEQSGFRVVEIRGNHIFYTGYGLLPGLSLSVRSVLCRFLGDACVVFMMRASNSASVRANTTQRPDVSSPVWDRQATGQEGRRG